MSTSLPSVNESFSQNPQNPNESTTTATNRPSPTQNIRLSLSLTPEQIGEAIIAICKQGHYEFSSPEMQSEFWFQVTYALGKEYVSTARTMKKLSNLPDNYKDPAFRVFCGSWLLTLVSECDPNR